MPVSLDCINCLTRQALEAARFACNDETKHAAALKRSLQVALDKGFTTIPPLVARDIQRVVREETGNPDPYGEQKRRFNALMLGVRDAMRARIRDSRQPLQTAVQLAIAGNAIDFAVRADWTDALVLDAIESALRQPINGDLDAFLSLIGAATHVLYLLDNCGEIVCDQLLIEELKRRRPELAVTAVVRGSPVLNDATWDDVHQVGLDATVPVIDNGDDAIGTVLELCGPDFQAAFDACDLIIAKGLANFETLVEYGPDRLAKTVCFLFKAKCPFIARFADVELGDLVLRNQFARTNSAG